MIDYRVKVKVVFTIDVSVEEEGSFETIDKAEAVTRQVFEESFSRAHLLRIETEELLTLKRNEN